MDLHAQLKVIEELCDQDRLLVAYHKLQGLLGELENKGKLRNFKVN